MQHDSLVDINGSLTDIEKVRTTVNRAIDIGTRKFGELRANSHSYDEFLQNLNATRLMFRLRETDLQRADLLLGDAQELHPRGLFLTKRAYIRACLVSEAGVVRDAELCGEAEALATAALEQEPRNSSVLAMVSHVYSLLFRRHHAAHELARQVVSYNLLNPLAHAYLGRAKAYLGDT